MRLLDPRHSPVRVACFATQGPGSGDEQRITALLEPLSPRVIPFHRGARLRAGLELARAVRRTKPDIVVMEGTGIAGGVAVLGLRWLTGLPYIVSSGDAVAPFWSSLSSWLSVPGLGYEWLLTRGSSGFIAWSPYLAGRALTFGAPRAMTAPNWSAPSRSGAGPEIRRALGIPLDAIVFGLVGSLNWNRRYGYCYGLELVQAASGLARENVCVLLVGDGDGRRELEQRAGERLGTSIFIPGSVARERVHDYLDAIDVASLPQSVDGVGSFRYTTKISEYLEAGLPIVTGQIPLAYDLDDGSIWRLPGDAPWDPSYVEALADLMSTVQAADVKARQPRAGVGALFDRERQIRQVSAFVTDVLGRERSASDR